VLETLAELVAEANAPVSQAAIADRAGLSDKITSYWMTMLDELGFVNRAPEDDARAYGVLLSEDGKRLLELLNARLERSGVIARD
jgi:hypothetical protein